MADTLPEAGLKAEGPPVLFRTPNAAQAASHAAGRGGRCALAPTAAPRVSPAGSVAVCGRSGAVSVLFMATAPTEAEETSPGPSSSGPEVVRRCRREEQPLSAPAGAPDGAAQGTGSGRRTSARHRPSAMPTRSWRAARINRTRSPVRQPHRPTGVLEGRENPAARLTRALPSQRPTSPGTTALLETSRS